jgi:hypothetical protein
VLLPTQMTERTESLIASLPPGDSPGGVRRERCTVRESVNAKAFLTEFLDRRVGISDVVLTMWMIFVLFFASPSLAHA